MDILLVIHDGMMPSFEYVDLGFLRSLINLTLTSNDLDIDNGSGKHRGKNDSSNPTDVLILADCLN